jgi:ABC-type transport system involved in multi-copper enzyme maturation permease subunit
VDARPVQARPVTLARVIAAEWLKFRTLRSTLAVLAAAVLGMLAIALVVGFNTRRLTPDLDANDLTPSATMQGYYLGQLLIGALGVLFVSGEYSTGMIRSTLVAVPRRLPVLVGKVVVFVGVVLVSMAVSCLVAFLASQALIAHYRTGYSLSDPGALRVVLGTAVYLTLAGLIGAAYGWVVRSTPGALVAYFATLVVVPVLFGSVLGTWGKHVAEFLPSQAGAAFSTSVPEGLSLRPWTGLGVMALWAVVALVVSAVLLRRRDA